MVKIISSLFWTSKLIWGALEYLCKKLSYLYYFPDYEKIKKEKKNFKSNISNKDSGNLKSTENINSNHKSNYIYSSPFRTINNEDFVNNTLNKKIKKSIIYQPTMRYKPRTDLERIYDVLNGYHCNEKSRDIIERQLRAINLYDFKKSRDSINSLGKEDYVDGEKILLQKVSL